MFTGILVSKGKCKSTDGVVRQDKLVEGVKENGN